MTFPLFIDVTRLTADRFFHSGISRYVRKILAGLRELEKEDKFKIYPVITNKKYAKSATFAKLRSAFEESIGGTLYDEDDVKSMLLEENDIGLPGVYFSPYEPFPEWSLHPNLLRVVTVYDLFHIQRADLYGADFTNNHLKALEKSLAPEDIAVCISEFTRAETIKRFQHPPQNTFTVPLAAESNFKTRKQSEVKALAKRFGLPKEFFVFFAQNDQRKNSNTVISTMRELAAEGLMEMDCVVVASSTRAEKITAEFKEAGISSDKLTIISGLSDDDLAALYSGAEFLLYPSLAEGFGLPIVEAQSCGCPVITSSTTSMPEVASLGALYVNPFKKDQVKRALALMMGSKTLRESLAELSLDNAQNFSWDKTVSETAAVISHSMESWISDRIEFTDENSEASLDKFIDATPASDVKAIRGALVKSVDLRYSQSNVVSTKGFIENIASGTHGVLHSFEKSHPNTPFRLIFMAKPLGRRSLTIQVWAESSRKTDGNDFQIDFQFDTGKLDIRKASHHQVLVESNIAEGESGWVIFDLLIDLKIKSDIGLAVALAARPEHGTSLGYPGQEIPSFSTSEMRVAQS